MGKTKPTYHELEQRVAELETALQNKSKRDLLEEETENFVFAFENANIGICYTDLKGNFIKVNPELANILGYTVEEIEHKNVTDITHADFLDLSRTYTERAIKGKEKSFAYEKQYHQKGGNIITCSIKSSIVCDKHGESKYFISHILDITERTKAKQELQKKEAHLRSIFEAMSEGFSIQDVICDEDGNPCDLRFVDANPAFERQTGLKNADTLGHTLLELFPESEKYWVERYGKVGLTGEPISFEAMFGPLNIHYQVNAFQTKHAQFGTMFTDINERKLSEIQLKEKSSKIETQNQELSLAIKQLQQAKEHAEESDRLKTAFLNNMSHEIRTPLNAIIGLSEMLVEKEYNKEKRQTYGEIIVKSGYQLLSIVNDILDIAKIEAGLISLNETLTNLVDVCMEAHDSIREQAKKKNIDLKISAAVGFPTEEILVDRIKLMQVLGNLLNNALKFTDKGSIRMIYNKKGNDIEFSISDTGIGIEEEIHAKIFDRFRQAELTATRNYGGAGLGLSICKELITKMNGKIWVQSELGKGSTFFFTIPYKIIEDIKPTIDESKIMNKEDYSQITVLIAEDEEINYLFISELLIEMKMNVIRAKNGREALDYVMSDKPVDIILMDIKMPVMNGYEATQRIKNIKPALPVIAVTAHAFLEDQQQAIAAGCDNYLPKPVKKEKLLKTIRKLLKL